MKLKKTIETDILVIGAGMAGMVAAARSSSLGLRTVQAGNSSVFFFASGLFDLLGVYPVDPVEIITDPYSGIKKLQQDKPFHPYAKVSQHQIRQSLEFVKDFLQPAGLNYHLPKGSPDDLPDNLPVQTNTKILTSVGTLKSTYMVPETFSKGCDLHRQKKNLLIVDFKGLRGFSAKQAAAGLKMKKGDIFTLSIDLPENKAGLNPVHLAKLFETPGFVQELSDKLSAFSGRADLVGMPAVCGIRNSQKILKTIETQTGMDVFEIPGMPPSIPGLRMKNAFEKQLSDHKIDNREDNQANSRETNRETNRVKFLSNARVVFLGMEGSTFSLNAVNDNHETGIRAKCVILASGRFPGGGLFATRNRILETVFKLPVFQPEKRDGWHRLNFFDPKGHMINQAGLETDDQFRPISQKERQKERQKEEPAFENLYAAGSILAHNDWARLKSGAGVSCVSAYTAVTSFYDKNYLK